MRRGTLLCRAQATLLTGRRPRLRRRVAHAARKVHAVPVPSGSTSSYVFAPVMAFAVLAVIILLLRWTFSTGHSLVAKSVKPGTEDAYGLLVAIASPTTYVEGEMLRRTLEDAGVRANLAQTVDGPRLMVFPGDEAAARRVLSAR